MTLGTEGVVREQIRELRKLESLNAWSGGRASQEDNDAGCHAHEQAVPRVA